MFEHLEYLTRIKQKEMLLNAEAQQLINEALAAREREQSSPFYYGALAALGHRLTELGERLEAQYNAARQMPLELPPLERVTYE
jgi:hypothetical protein